MISEDQKHPDSEIIDDLGGTTKTAKIFDINPASVSEWRRTGIPAPRKMYLRLAHPGVFIGREEVMEKL